MVVEKDTRIGPASCTGAGQAPDDQGQPESANHRTTPFYVCSWETAWIACALKTRMR
jgi:hypothetical protein